MFVAVSGFEHTSSLFLGRNITSCGCHNMNLICSQEVTLAFVFQVKAVLKWKKVEKKSQYDRFNRKNRNQENKSPEVSFHLVCITNWATIAKVKVVIFEIKAGINLIKWAYTPSCFKVYRIM